jgi:hypothetical protein
VGKLGADTVPAWVGRMGIPHAEEWWRPATAVLRALAGRQAGAGLVGDTAAAAIPPIASYAAPRLEAAGEAVGSKTLGERASGAADWLERRLPGFLKKDPAPFPHGVESQWERAVERPAYSPSDAAIDAAQPRRTSEWVNRPQGWRESIVDPPPPAEPFEPAPALVRPAEAPARATPAAPAPDAADTQWQQFRQAARVTPAGEIPIGAPAADPGIELSLTGPNVLPPTAADLAAPPSQTASEVLQQQATGRQPMTAQQLDQEFERMKQANAAKRAAEQNPATDIPARTLPDGSPLVLDDDAARAAAENFDPVSAFNERFGTGTDPYEAMKLNKATAQERRMSALTNKAIRPDLLPESTGLRGADALGFNPETGEIVNWDDVPGTATEGLIRAAKRKP